MKRNEKTKKKLDHSTNHENKKTQLRSRGSVRKCEQVLGADATFECAPVFIPALLLRTVTARIYCSLETYRPPPLQK